jgi:hypothetical protein
MAETQEVEATPVDQKYADALAAMDDNNASINAAQS